MLLEKLKDAAWVFQRRVAFRVTVRISLVVPGLSVVLVGGFVESGEETIFEEKLVTDDEGGIGVSPHVVVMEEIVLQDMFNETSEERDIRAWPNLEMMIGDCRGSRESRINGDDGGATCFPGFKCPLKSARVVFRRVGTHDQDDIGILDVFPVVGHCTAAEGGGQTGHRGTVSYASLMIDVD